MRVRSGLTIVVMLGLAVLVIYAATPITPKSSAGEFFGTQSAGQSSTVDPVIRTGGGSGSVAISSPNFIIVSPSGNSPGTSDCILIQNGVSTPAPGCFFLNDITTGQGAGNTGSTITQLVFVASRVDFSGSLTCQLSTALGGVSPWFTKCTAPSAAAPVVIFSGGSGIPFGGDFSVGFREFNTNSTFRVAASGSF